MSDIKKTGDGGGTPPHVPGTPPAARGTSPKPDGEVRPVDGYLAVKDGATDVAAGVGPTSMAARLDPAEIEVWNSVRISQEILGLAKRAAALYSRDSRSHASDARNIFIGALSYLKEKGFDPETKEVGKTPTDSQIATALLRGFNGYYSDMPPAARTISKSDIEKTSRGRSAGGKVFVLFKSFIDGSSAQLNLVGKKQPKAQAKKKSQAPTFKAETVAHRVLTALHIVTEIEGMRDELADPHTLDSMLKEARRIDRDLRSLGRDEATLTPKLRRIASRTSALQKIKELESIRNDTLTILTRETTDFNDERINQYVSNISDNVDEWIQKNTADLYWIDPEGEKVAIAPTLFQTIADQAIRSYVAIWLSEQKAGETRRRLEITESAFKKARLLITHKFASVKEEKAIKGLIGRLFHHVARQDASRIEGSKTDRSPGTAEEGSFRNIHSLTNLEAIIGPDLIAELDGYYDDIRSGVAGTETNHDIYAQSFYELFLQYIRRAHNEHGAEFGPEVLSRRGLETRFIRAIFLRVDGARERFDDKTLELLINFFTSQFSDSSSLIKSEDDISKLKPSLDEYAIEERAKAASTQRLGNFIPYDHRVSHRDYVYQVMGVGEPYFEEDFNDHKLGITWKSSLGWGSIRENPDTIGVLHWQRIVEKWYAILAFAETEGILTDAMLEMPDPTIEKRPETISTDLWNAYAGWRVSIGRGEDVTVEPRGEDGVSAMISRYEYLSEIAEAQGQRIDFLEYLATIYPPIARMLLRADNEGVIELSEPDPLHNRFYETWSYMTWAQQVHFGGYEAYTGVRAATFDSHRAQEVIPEHWDARRYATPEMSERLGIEREELIVIINGYLRSVREILPRVDVRDTRNARLSPELRRRRSKYTIKFNVVDKREQSLPTIKAAKGLDRIIDDHIKAGAYDGRIDYIRNYLGTISLLIPNASVSDPQNGTLALSDIENELEAVSKEHLIKSSIYRDATTTSSSYSPDDIREVREFYKHDLEGFARRVLLEAPITGTIHLGEEDIHFHLLHSQTPFVADGHIGLAIGEIVSTSKRESWGNDLTLEVLKIKAAVAHLMSIGELSPSDAKTGDRVEAAVTPLIGGGELLGVALQKFLGLKNGDFTTSPNTDVENDDTPPPPESIPTIPAGPKLPKGIKWQNLFAQIAADEHALTESDIKIGTAVLRDYFDAVKYLYRRFWPHTLGRIVEEHKSTNPEGIQRAILAFFNGIGVPTTIEGTSANADGGSVDHHIATLAFEDYRDLFPQPSQSGNRIRLPLNEALVTRLIELHIENYTGSSAPDFTGVTRLVHANIDEFNADALVPQSNDLEIPHDGLLGRTLRLHANTWLAGRAQTAFDLPTLRRALFNLSCAIGFGTTPERSQIGDALSSTGREGATSDLHIDLLNDTISTQIELQNALLEIVKDPEIGISRFFSDNYRAPHLDVTNLSELAQEYVRLRITSNLPIDIEAMAEHFVDANLSQYPAVALQVAHSYRTVLSEWIQSIRSTFGDPIELAHLAIPPLAEDAATPSASLNDFRERVATEIDDDMTYEGLNQLEARYGYLATFLGLELSPSLDQATSEAYTNSVQPAQSQLDDELTGIVDRVAEVHGRSYEIYLATKSVDLDGVDEEAATARLAELEASWQIITGLQDEVTALYSLKERAAAIIEIRTNDTARDRALETLPSNLFEVPEAAPEGTIGVLELQIQSAMAFLNSADGTMLGNSTALEEHLSSLESERLQGVAAKTVALVHNARQALADAHNEVTSKIDETTNTHIADIEALTVDLSGTGGNRALFIDAVTRFTALRGTAITAAQELSASDGILDTKLSDTETVIADARQTLTDVGEVHGKKLQQAISQLVHLLETANATRNSVTETNRTLLAAMDTATKAIATEESKLTPAEPANLAKPKPLRTDIDDSLFITGKPKSGAHRLAASSLDNITRSQILSTNSKSYLIPLTDAVAIRRWRDSDRSEALQLTSVLGDEIIINPHTYGINITRIEDADPASPLANLSKKIGMLLQRRSNELILLGDLARSEESTEYYRNLISHIAYLDSDTKIDEIHTTIRSWAVANRRILNARYLKKERSSDITHDDYDSAVHANWHNLYDTYLKNPHMGMLVVRNGLPGREEDIIWAGPVDTRDAQRSIDTKGNTFRYMHGATGEWTEIDLRSLPGVNSKTTLFIAPFYRTSVEGILTLRTNWVMSGDPSLLDLGWIYQMANQSVELDDFPVSTERQHFGQFIHGLILPTSRTPIGEGPPLTLHETQTLATTAYHVAMNRPSPIKFEAVSDRALMGWIESIPERIEFSDDRDITTAEFRAELKKPEFREFIAKLYLAYHYSDDEESESIALRTFLAIATTGAWHTEHSVVHTIERIIRENTNKIYRNMHDPLFAPIDEGLERAHPEVGAVGRGQLWAVIKALEPNMAVQLPKSWPMHKIKARLAKAPAWIKPMMHRLPSMAKLITIVALTYESLPKDFRDKFMGLFYLCFDNSRIPSDTMKASIEDRLRKLYASQSQAGVAGHDTIIKALSANLTDDFTLARWLTGETDPWIQRSNSWQTADPAYRLRMLAPELMKARRFILEFAGEKLAAGRQANPISESMKRFVERNPELKSAIIVIYFLLMKMDEVYRHKIFQFFELQAQDQRPELFAEMITNGDMLSEIRRTLREPFGDDGAVTNAFQITGMEEPELPLELLSPVARLQYLAPNIFKQDPAFVEATIKVSKTNGQLTNLTSLARNHRELRPAIAALALAMLRFDRGKRYQVYDAFDKLPNLTPEDFVDTLIELLLLDDMNAICGDNPISENELLIPTFELDAEDQLPSTHIEYRIDELEMLPRVGSQAFQQLVRSHLDQEATTYEDELRRNGQYKGQSKTVIKRHVAQLFNETDMAHKKVILLAKLIDPTESFYDRMTKHNQAKLATRLDSLQKDKHAVSRLITWFGYTFMIKNRDEVLAARDRLKADGGSSSGPSGSSGPQGAGGGSIVGGGGEISGHDKAGFSSTQASPVIPTPQYGPASSSPIHSMGATRPVWVTSSHMPGISAARFHPTSPTWLPTHVNQNVIGGAIPTMMGASQLFSPVNMASLSTMSPTPFMR
ncbi:MAG: hypothetical protein HN337_02650 [Deltaproteobacteria bacterium]|nr:hypothetical protein [Deltaproteobacteria bacterium]